MLAKNKFGLFTAIFAFALVISSDGWAAPKLPQDAKSRAGRCDARWLACGNGCDQLIDIGDTVANCNKACDARHGRCMIWAGKGSRT